MEVTLALAILLTVGIPGFSSMIQNNRIVTQTNGFVSSLHLARSEAVKRGLPVSICPTTNPTAATPACAGSGNWATGWLVFTDDSGTEGAFDGTDQLLQVHEPLKGDLTLTSDDSNDKHIRFLATGFLDKGANLDLTLARPDCSGKPQQRDIRITATGQVRVAKAVCP
jgi:type IV fimbrial biogenesis protein FimT